MIIAWNRLFIASAAVGSAWFTSVLDCNPYLYLYEKLVFRNKKKSNEFSEKTIWIIGASSGIGKELAEQFSSQGKCGCLILSSRNDDALENVQQTCRKLNPSCRYECLPLDVTQLDQLKQVIEKVVGTSGKKTVDDGQRNTSNSISTVDDGLDLPPLDMVVLNAGAGQLCPALETHHSVVQSVMQTNAIWPMIFMPMLLEYYDNGLTKNMGRTRNPSVTNSHTPYFLVTSSVAAKVPVPLSAPYAAAKAALQHYFESLSAERPDLCMDLVCPGPVDTQFHSNHLVAQKQQDITFANDPTNSVAHGSANENKNDGGLFSSSRHNDKPVSSLKMPVKRCVQLIIAAASLHSRRDGGLREYWIAQQPTLAVLYLNQFIPSLMRLIFARVGEIRLQMWRDGLDLYDSSSWTKSRPRRKSKLDEHN